MGNSKKSDSIAWLNNVRRRLLAELIKGTNRSLDGLDSVFGSKLKRTDKWHRGWLIRCSLIINLQDICAADSKARILEIGNRVALELDNEVVLHFWKHDVGLQRNSADPLDEAAKAYELKQGEQVTSATAPTTYVQLALEGFEVEPQYTRVPELIPSVRHIGVEYTCRHDRLVALQISAKDENGRTVAETIGLKEADRAENNVATPSLPDVELKADKRDEDKDA